MLQARRVVCNTCTGTLTNIEIMWHREARAVMHINNIGKWVANEFENRSLFEICEGWQRF